MVNSKYFNIGSIIYYLENSKIKESVIEKIEITINSKNEETIIYYLRNGSKKTTTGKKIFFSTKEECAMFFLKKNNVNLDELEKYWAFF